MRVTYLLSNDGLGGTQRSVLSQVTALKDVCDVDMVLVLKRESRPFFEVDPRVRSSYLVDVTSDPRPVRPDAIADGEEYRKLFEAPPKLIEPQWEGLFNRLTEMELESALRTMETDVLVTTTPALLALAVKLAPATTAIIHQDHRTSELRARTLQPLLEFGPDADAMVFLTEPTRAWFAAALADEAPPLHVIPNSIPHGPHPLSALDSRTVVMSGRLVREKQPDHVLAAFEIVARQAPDWRLRILGDGPWLEPVRRQVVRSGLHNHVEVVGATPHMEREWAKAAVGVLASMVEGQAVVILEAMAAGVPFVSYDSPNGPSSLIRHGETGLLVPRDNIPALASALLRLTTDERYVMGAAALRASLEYRPEAIAGRWLALFREVADSRGAKGPRQPIESSEPRPIEADPEVGGSQPTNPSLASEPIGGSERDLMERRPELRRFRQRLWIPIGDMTIAELRQQDLDLVVDALEPARVAWVHVKGPGWTRTNQLVLREEERDRALEALVASAHDEAVYASDPDSAGWTLVGDLDEDHPTWRARVIRVNRFYANPERTLQLGPSHGCDLVFVGGDEFEARSASPGVDEVDFRVDVVYLASASSSLGVETARFALRSVDMFAPWVDTIFVVSVVDLSEWVDVDSDRVRVIAPSEIGLEPTMSSVDLSTAIAARVHHLPGLSEHYLLFREGFYLGRPVEKELFFLSNGMARYFPSPETIPFVADGPDEPIHRALVRNARDLFEGEFGRTFTRGFRPAPIPQLRSVNEELESRFAEQHRLTTSSASPPSDRVDFVESLHHHFAYMTGRAVPGHIRSRLIELRSDDAEAALMRLLATRDLDAFGLLDNQRAGSTQVGDQTVLRFLEMYLPIRSRAERRERDAGR